ncbi:MAG: hypothetical protein AB1742_14575 [bacterium]
MKTNLAGDGHVHPVMIIIVMAALLAAVAVGGTYVAPHVIRRCENALFNLCAARIDAVRRAAVEYHRVNGVYSDEGLWRHMNFGSDRAVEIWVGRACTGAGGERWDMKTMIYAAGGELVVEGYTRHGRPCRVTAAASGLRADSYRDCLRMGGE